MVGVESHADLRVTPLLWLEGGVDYVRGDLTTLDTPMPRIPPLRGRLGVRVQKNAFQVGGEGTFTAKQDRIYAPGFDEVSVGETPTDGYNLLKLFAAYSFGTGAVVNTITFRFDNVTDVLYYNHLNYLKDLAPEMGRSLSAVYSVRF